MRRRLNVRYLQLTTVPASGGGGCFPGFRLPSTRFGTSQWAMGKRHGPGPQGVPTKGGAACQLRAKSRSGCVSFASGGVVLPASPGGVPSE